MSACNYYPGQQRCTRCNDWLCDVIEVVTRICVSCSIELYEHEQRRREWDYYYTYSGDMAP